MRAVLVAIDDERRAEFRGERRERAASLRALFERAWVVAKEKVDLAAAGGIALAAEGERPVDYRAYGAALAVSVAVAFGRDNVARAVTEDVAADPLAQTTAIARSLARPAGEPAPPPVAPTRGCERRSGRTQARASSRRSRRRRSSRRSTAGA